MPIHETTLLNSLFALKSCAHPRAQRISKIARHDIRHVRKRVGEIVECDGKKIFDVPSIIGGDKLNNHIMACLVCENGVYGEYSTYCP